MFFHFNKKNQLRGKKIIILITRKNPWVIWWKPIQKYPLRRNELYLISNKYITRSNYMINFKTYSSGRNFIFVFEILDEWDMWSIDGKKLKEMRLFISFSNSDGYVKAFLPLPNSNPLSLAFSFDNLDRSRAFLLEYLNPDPLFRFLVTVVGIDPSALLICSIP